MERKIGTQLVILLGEGFIMLVSGALLYVFISRRAGAELLGQYSLVQAWITLFQALGNFGLPEFIMREVGRFFHDESKYISHGLIIGLSSSSLTMAIMTVLVIFFPYDPEVEKALLLGVFTLTPVMVFDICRGGFLAHKKTEWVLFNRLVECLIVIPASIYLIIQGYGIISLILITVGGKICSSIFSLYLLNKYIVKLQWKLDTKFCQQLLLSISTFALSNTLGLVSLRVNPIMLSIWGTLSTVGLYAAMSKIMEVMSIVPTMFAHLIVSQFARSFSIKNGQNREYYEVTIHSLFVITVPLGVVVLFFSRPIIEILFGQRFVDSSMILRILAIQFLVESADIIMGMILRVAGHQKADVRIFLTNPVTNITLNLLLIPIFGGVGAALSKLIGVLCSCSLRYMFISKRLVRLNWLHITAKPFLVSLALVACMILFRAAYPFFF
jgi:O-antigen/teichoic acid export membrane protein